MRKKTIAIIIVLIIAVITALAYLVPRLLNRGRDIIGVTSFEKTNEVIMNSATGSEFVKGTGMITIGEGQHAHLSWKLKEGSFDLAFVKNAEDGQDAGTETEGLALPDPAIAERTYDMMEEGIEGSGETDFELEAGVYEVDFIMHGAVGTAKLTSGKN